MLKGKKKALAAQVLLGLMVAGNVYTVDCGVASAADFTIAGGPGSDTSTTHYVPGWWMDSDVLVGNGGALLGSTYTDISGNSITIVPGGADLTIIKGTDITNNVINLTSPQTYMTSAGDKVFKFFDASGTCSGNTVNLSFKMVKDNYTQKFYAGGTGNNIVNIFALDPAAPDGTHPDNTDGSQTLSLDVTNGTINVIGNDIKAGEFKSTNLNVEGSGTEVNKVDTTNLYIGKNGSLNIKDSVTNVSSIRIDGSASENALTLGNGATLGSNVQINVENAVDTRSSALFVKEAVVDTSSGNVRLNKTITGTREQTKSLVETQMASMALANGSADLVAGAGYTNAAQAVKEAKESGNAASAMVPYAAANYGSMRQESGSYVDVDSANFNIGFAKEVKNSNGTLLFGPMVEYGRGNYESHLDDGTVGTGTGQSFGVGVMARQTNDNGFYYEGSLRYGKSTSTYSSNNLVAGKTISYDNSANYWGAHAGVGKVVKLSGDNSIDMYGKLFYTRQGASSVNVDGDTLDFSAVSSKRSRIGFRYIHGTSQVRSIYAGLAWQHEFDGSAHATANGFSTPSPSVKGDSGMLELGVLIAPKASPVSFDLGVSGWAGKQKGYSLNANMCWSF